VTDDPYTDPASGVLLNRLGITDPERLLVVETGLTQAALAGHCAIFWPAS
jgi:hypothetical protein